MVIFENATTAIDVQHYGTAVYISVIVYDDIQCGRFLPQRGRLEVEDTGNSYKVFETSNFMDELAQSPLETAAYYFIFAR